jgi:hypothetical protein
MSDHLVNMFRAQLKLQEEYGTNPTKMNDEQRIQFFKDMMLATIAELNEALNEIGWKSWATSRHINEEAAFGELRDAWQFLTNMMFTVYQTTPERMADLLEDSLSRKHAINYARHAASYDGVSTKCPECRRDFSEIVIDEIHAPDGFVEMYICQCGCKLPYEQTKTWFAASVANSK